jgi:hypothetical protein
MLNRRFLLLAGIAALVLPGAGQAHEYTLGNLRIVHPWTRATPPSARVAGGFLTIENKGAEPDRLVGATFERAGAVELHEMALENGVMRMREIAGGIAIAPGATVTLKPGGLHVMFMGLSGQLRQGEKFKGTLVFERAGRIDVEFAVEAMGAAGQTGHGHH